MFKSSRYFFQNAYTLEQDLILLELWLLNHDFDYLEIECFKKAFNYFCECPKQFDGATIVRDIQIINDLDPFAMLHDYQYIHAKIIKDRLQSDKRYLKNMIQGKIHPVTAHLRYLGCVFINISGFYDIYQIFNPISTKQN